MLKDRLIFALYCMGRTMSNSRFTEADIETDKYMYNKYFKK